MGMSEFYGTRDDEESLATIRRALDLGIDFLDTADVYGPYINEQLVGKAIKGRRHEVIVATKFGNVRTPDGGWAGVNGRPEYVRTACDASLQRLGVDHIDLYYQHRVDRNVPIEDTVGAMSDLVSQGKIRYVGLSEASAETIRRAYRVHPISALQSEYSLWTRELEDEVLPLCRDLNIGLVAYSPLGRGFLTGRFRKQDEIGEGDRRRIFPRFQGENFEKNLELVARIEDIARQNNCTASQLALAWLLARGNDIVPIPGTKRRDFLEENAGAVHISLSPQDQARIDEAVPKGAAAGARYPEQAMRTVNA
jgi:aryl-alcohol dehydrogenase-like predicted oxidoreductase